ARGGLAVGGRVRRARVAGLPPGGVVEGCVQGAARCARVRAVRWGGPRVADERPLDPPHGEGSDGGGRPPRARRGRYGDRGRGGDERADHQDRGRRDHLPPDSQEAHHRAWLARVPPRPCPDEPVSSTAPPPYPTGT